MKELMRVDHGAWSAEVPDIERHFAEFGDRLPERLIRQLQELKEPSWINPLVLLRGLMLNT